MTPVQAQEPVLANLPMRSSELHLLFSRHRAEDAVQLESGPQGMEPNGHIPASHTPFSGQHTHTDTHTHPPAQNCCSWRGTASGGGGRGPLPPSLSYDWSPQKRFALERGTTAAHDVRNSYSNCATGINYTKGPELHIFGRLHIICIARPFWRGKLLWGGGRSLRAFSSFACLCLGKAS